MVPDSHKRNGADAAEVGDDPGGGSGENPRFQSKRVALMQDGIPGMIPTTASAANRTYM